MPFGTFIMCSSDATSFENPDSILKILVALASVHDKNQELESVDYGNIVKSLYLKATCIGFSTQAENMTDPDSLATGISLQLQALGLTPHMQVGEYLIFLQELESYNTQLTHDTLNLLVDGLRFDPLVCNYH
jgi:hypothetical protein